MWMIGLVVLSKTFKLSLIIKRNWHFKLTLCEFLLWKRSQVTDGDTWCVHPSVSRNIVKGDFRFFKQSHLSSVTSCAQKLTCFHSFSCLCKHALVWRLKLGRNSHNVIVSADTQLEWLCEACSAAVFPLKHYCILVISLISALLGAAVYNVLYVDVSQEKLFNKTLCQYCWMLIAWALV